MNGDSDSRLLESGPSRDGPPGATRASKNARGSRHFCYTMVRLQLLLLVVYGWVSERMRATDRVLLLSCLSHLQLQLQQRGRSLWPRKAEPQPALRAWPAGSRLCAAPFEASSLVAASG